MLDDPAEADVGGKEGHAETRIWKSVGRLARWSVKTSKRAGSYTSIILSCINSWLPGGLEWVAWQVRVNGLPKWVGIKNYKILKWIGNHCDFRFYFFVVQNIFIFVISKSSYSLRTRQYLIRFIAYVSVCEPIQFEPTFFDSDEAKLAFPVYNCLLKHINLLDRTNFKTHFESALWYPYMVLFTKVRLWNVPLELTTEEGYGADIYPWRYMSAQHLSRQCRKNFRIHLVYTHINILIDTYDRYIDTDIDG